MNSLRAQHAKANTDARSRRGGRSRERISALVVARRRPGIRCDGLGEQLVDDAERHDDHPDCAALVDASHDEELLVELCIVDAVLRGQLRDAVVLARSRQALVAATESSPDRRVVLAQVTVDLVQTNMENDRRSETERQANLNEQIDGRLPPLLFLLRRKSSYARARRGQFKRGGRPDMPGIRGSRVRPSTLSQIYGATQRQFVPSARAPSPPYCANAG